MSAKSYRAQLERIEDLAPGKRALFLRLPEGRGLELQAGQFVSVRLPGRDAELVRAYSVASDPKSAELLEIALDRVEGGPGSGHLFSLAVGAEIDFTGPWGSFVLPAPPPPSAVFIAENTGVAPLRPMVGAALASAEVRELRLLHAAADGASLLYRGEFERWAREDSRFGFETLIEGGGSHEALVGLVRQRYVDADGDRGRHFFICGVGEIVPRLRDLLRGAGYERRAVHYEKW